MRLNKYIAASGTASRRKADELVFNGNVRVNGMVVKEPGYQVQPDDTVEVNGSRIIASDKKVYIAMNKPLGYVTTMKDQFGRPAVADLVTDIEERVFPVGRLDKDSQGLILLTNQGELVNKINRQRYGHEKEYIVSCRRPVTDEFLKAMSEGVKIRIPVTDVTDRDKRNARGREYVDKVTRPCKAWRVDRYTFGIILTQGYNRQIRRMCDALGNYVKTLKRIRVMNIELSGASLARLSGRTSFCEIDLSGASSLSGISELQKYSFRVDECTGELSGASSAMFVCDGRITCSLSGASLLSYMGDADTSGSYTSGGSEIVGCRY